MRIILSVTSDLVTDQRIHKIASSLRKTGFEVKVIGRKLKNSKELEPQIYETERIKLFFEKKIFFYAEYNLRMFFKLLFSRCDILLSNDLDTLTANFLVSKIRNKILIYDSHEYFTEVPELQERNFVKKIWTKIEKFILPKINFSYTVCQSIADEYRKKYGIAMNVIRNLPYFNNENSQKNFISNKKIILYQGVLNKGRGLELMLETMKFIENAIFVIIGDGDIAEKLKNIVNENFLQEKVLFLGKIPFSKLRSYTLAAEIGISLEENLGLNYYFALPNKIFDYIAAKIPVLVSDLPEMKRIIENFNVGMVAKSRKPQELAAQINEMLFNNELRNIWEKNLNLAAAELCWEKEEQKLLSIFNFLKNE